MQAHKQLEALNQILKHCKNAAFYKKRIPEHPLTSLLEFKTLPFTTKDDLRQNSPFGLIAVPRSRLQQYHESFGTTGLPVSSWFTREDIEDIADIFKGWGVRLNQDDMVLIRFPYAISSPAHLVQTAAQAQGACVIPASSRSTVSPFPRIIHLLQKLEVTVLAGLPLQMVLIAETAELLGLNPRKDFPHLRAICTAGEVLPESRRELIQNIWGKPVFDHYGMTEFGPVLVECEHQVPHIQDNYFYCEILANDLQSEVKPGEIGNLVITALKRRGSPIIRYLTGDRARLIEGNCKCGQTSSLQIRGRQEDTIPVNGRLLDRWDLEEMVSQLPCHRFWIAGPVKGGVHFVVEREKNTDQIEKEIIHQMETKYRMKIEAEITAKGSLYDRNELLDVGVVGKPKYIYTAAEMAEQSYLKSGRM